MAKKWMSLRIHRGQTKYVGSDQMANLQLPEGCSGILLVFDTKKAARKFWGETISLEPIEIETREVDNGN